MQKRAQELADELVGVGHAAARRLVSGEELAAGATRSPAGGAEPAPPPREVREAVEGLRPPTADQLDALRAQVEELEARVAELEAAAAAPAPAPAARPRANPPAARHGPRPPPSRARRAQAARRAAQARRRSRA